MNILILGACGKFMAGIAVIACEQGHKVIGVDANAYPPMSTMLEGSGVELLEGYEQVLSLNEPDVVIIGNVMSRGNVAVEHILNQGWSYVSGPQWLAEVGLKGKHVLAVSGTHGKTTTSSLVAWILEVAGLNPGFLIGGVPDNFNISARLTDSECFVIEADEYDSAFFDKRSKFIHYHPSTLIINNLEFDHADIFDSIEDIYKQFQYLLRTVPAKGSVISAFNDEHIKTVLDRGCWSKQSTVGIEGGDWNAKLINKDCSRFEVIHQDKSVGEVSWSLLGKHNVCNALSAMAAAADIGVSIDVCIQALASFESVKKRLQKIAEVNDVCIYDDFAHHPTAIKLTLEAMRAHVGDSRVIAVVELASYTMRSGYHYEQLMNAFEQAEHVFMLQPDEVSEGFQEMCNKASGMLTIKADVVGLVEGVKVYVKPGDHVVIMSNRGFGGIYELLPESLRNK